jgi:hypothetical protein
MGIESHLDETELSLMATISRLQPKWVYVPVETMKTFLQSAGERKGKELDAFVRDAIARRFRYLAKKPKWLQSPEWQNNDRGQPMVFVEQLALGDLYHDQSMVYVFVDAVERFAKCVIQSA